MLLFINSLPKCGSTWSFFVVDHCLRQLQLPSAFEVVPDLVNNWGNPGQLTEERLSALLKCRKTFCLKTHSACVPALRRLIDQESARVVWLIRHPLDIVASALDYGIRARELGETVNPYYYLYDIDDALDFCRPFWNMHASWAGRALVVRYEDLRENPLDAFTQILDHFSLPAISSISVSKAISQALSDFSVDNLMSGAAPQSADHIRLNRRTVGSRRENFAALDRERLKAELAPVIAELGYGRP